MMNISQKNSEAFKNPWVWAGLAFLCTFVSMNIFFIYQAFSSPPNLVLENFYERGRTYDDMQDRLARERELGWSGLIMAPADSQTGVEQRWEVLIQDKAGETLQFDTVELFAYRPSDAREDFSVSMHAQENGVYAADINFTLPGNWDIIVEARRGDDEFAITRRTFISRQY